MHTARLIGGKGWFLGASTEWPGGAPADVAADLRAIAASVRHAAQLGPACGRGASCRHAEGDDRRAVTPFSVHRKPIPIDFCLSEQGGEEGDGCRERSGFSGNGPAMPRPAAHRRAAGSQRTALRMGGGFRSRSQGLGGQALAPHRRCRNRPRIGPQHVVTCAGAVAGCRPCTSPEAEPFCNKAGSRPPRATPKAKTRPVIACVTLPPWRARRETQSNGSPPRSRWALS